MSHTAEYLLAFSSFYKAVYAQETLSQQGIRTSIRKLPPGLQSSCGYAIYFSASSASELEKVLDLLERKNIENMGIYFVERNRGKTNYRRVSAQ